jgi:hypothetical protein
MSGKRGDRTARWIGCFGGAIAALVIAAAPAAAQSSDDTPEPGTAKAILGDLVINRLNSDPARARALVDELTKGIVIGIAQAPVGASSAGFAYQFDSQTGERTLKSQSFGPLFVDRPLTNGQGVFSFGVGVTRADYSEFQGKDLDDEGILFFDNRVRFRDNNFEQFISEFIAVSPKVTTVSTLLGYGVTPSLDIGVIVPFTSIDLTARRYWNYDVSRSFVGDAETRAFFGQNGPRGENFQPPQLAPNGGSVSATGVGDITIRAKYAFGPQDGEGVAAVADVRLPTGDEDNLIGSGKTSTRIGLVGTKMLGETFSLTLNGGYRFGGLTDEGNYSAALDAALLPSKKLTASLEFVGHYLSEAVTEIGETVVFTSTNPETILRNTEPVFELGGVSNAYGAMGLKYNVGGSALLTAGLLLPIGDNGLKSKYTFLVGLDFAISRR